MNVFNRIVLLLESLAALAFGVIALLLIGGLIIPANVSPGGVLLNQWRFFAHLNAADANVAVLICGIIAAVALIVFILQLLPGRRQPRDFVVKEDARGRVTITRTSVRDLVHYEASIMPEVMEAHPVTDIGPKGLRVQVRASLSPEADAVQVAEALQDKIKQSIQRHTGMATAEVDVVTQIEPLEHTRRHGRKRVH